MSGTAINRILSTLTCLVIFVVISACGHRQDVSGQENQSIPESTVAGSKNDVFSYSKYDELLSAHVDKEGYVDYPALQAKRRELYSFVESMGRITETEYAAWNEPEQLALWINAYNAITLRYIVDNYPIQKGNPIAGLRYPANSIRQIPGVWTKMKSKVVGKDYTLEEIENEIIRKEFDEPRIHMAIVCASFSCPPLRNEAFTGENLESQLDDQSRAFLADPNKFRIDREKGHVRLSKIFRWFSGDFTGAYGTDASFGGHDAKERAVLNFISRYVDKGEAAYLQSAEYTIAYEAYDWSLNER